MSTLQENLDAIKLDKDTNLKPENLKKGITCLGITGTYEGSGGGTVEGIKQFSTVGEMQADTTAKEGDLAAVYRSEMQNATADSKFQVATFPDTVVLDTALTDYVEVRYRAVDDSVMFDCWGSLDSSNFMMDCFTESGDIRIQYTSEDGITYTRTDSTGNPVDFGTEIYYEYAEMWNDVIGKFIQTGGKYFEGLYEYGPYTDDRKFAAYTNLGYDTSFKYESESYISLDDLNKLKKALNNYDSKIYHVLVIRNRETPNVLTGYAYDYVNDGVAANGRYSANIMCVDGKLYAGYRTSNTKLTNIKFYKYTFDLETNEFTHSSVDAIKGSSYTSGSYTYNTYYGFDELVSNAHYVTVLTDIAYAECETSYISLFTPSSTKTLDIMFYTEVTYHHAQSQLTLSNKNEILPEKIGYGPKGVLTGDGSIYDCLDYNDIYNHREKSNIGIDFDTIWQKTKSKGIKKDSTIIQNIGESVVYHTLKPLNVTCDAYWNVSWGHVEITYGTSTCTVKAYDLNNNLIYNKSVSTTSSRPSFRFTKNNNGKIVGSTRDLSSVDIIFIDEIDVTITKKIVTKPSGSDKDCDCESLYIDDSNNVYMALSAGDMNGTDTVYARVYPWRSTNYTTILPSMSISTYNGFYDCFAEDNTYTYVLYRQSNSSTLCNAYAVNKSTRAVSSISISGIPIWLKDLTTGEVYYQYSNKYERYKITGTTSSAPTIVTTRTNSESAQYLYEDVMFKVSAYNGITLSMNDESITYSASNCGDEVLESGSRQLVNFKFDGTTIISENSCVINNTLYLETLTLDLANKPMNDSYNIRVLPLGSTTQFTRALPIQDLDAGKDYTGTVTPTEYNTAIDTANEILGEEV